MDVHQHLYQTQHRSVHQRVSVTRVTAEDCDYESPLHSHAEGQLVLALRGGIRCSIDGQVWMVAPHSAVWIPPSSRHRNFFTCNAEVCMAFIAADEAVSHLAAGSIAATPLLKALLLKLARLPDDENVNAADAPSPSPSAYRQTVCDLLVMELQQAAPQAHAIAVLHHPKLRLLYETLLREPHNREGSAVWAKRLAISERTLSRLMQQDSGLSFARWRQQVRLLHALLWLAEGQSVQQVAMDLGYESVTAFITVFKKRLGVTPKRYVLDGSGERNGSAEDDAKWYE